MLESEQNLQASANEALSLATGACLEHFDADGSPIVVADRKLSSKGRLSKRYQTPYGEVQVERHVYQGTKGGATFCPMEQDARIFRTATPLFAKQCAMKYANTDSAATVLDFAQHGRHITRSYAREVGSDVALIAIDKEECWQYTPPKIAADKQVQTISIGVDGAMLLTSKGGGWRQSMVGTIALYDEVGERLHTTYVAAAPEYGKASFFEQMEREVRLIQECYPQAHYIGIADGAADHWPWLEEHTLWQVLDFWHATEYLAAVASVMGTRQTPAQSWLSDACHRLKHEKGAVEALIEEMETRLAANPRRKADRENLEATIGYFTNQKGRMNYSLHVEMGFPIGSGVTEAACKAVVKERMCGTGMRWDSQGAAEVLRLRAMSKTEGRWEDFWSHVTQYGFARITKPKRNWKSKARKNQTSD